MRPIDADALIKEYIADRAENDAEIISRADINNMPTLDAEPVVRCKDCKHFDNTNDIGWCKIHSHFSDGDWNSFSESDYCSLGERKDGAE